MKLYPIYNYALVRDPLGGAAIALGLLLLAGCAAVQTSSVSDPNREATGEATSTQPAVKDRAFAPLTGVPYMLPRGYLQVGLAVKNSADGKFESVDLKTETQLVPDESRIFLMGRGLDLLTRKDQKITLSNGMLSSVTTKDDAQAGEVLKAAASIWLNVLKIREVQGTLGAMNALDDMADTGLAVPRDLKHTSAALLHNMKSKEGRVQVLLEEYQELNAWPQVLDILRDIDTFYDEALAKIKTREKSTLKEQQALLSAGLVATPPILSSS